MITKTRRAGGLLFCLLVLAFAGGCRSTKNEEAAPPSPAETHVASPKEPAQGGDKSAQKRAVAREVIVTMRSRSPGDIAAKLAGLAEAQGGYIVNSDVRAAAPGTISAELSLRVPTTQLEPMLTQLRKMGDVRSELRKGDDVTSEVVDTEARLTVRRMFEKRLLELLSSARSIDDMLKVEAELSRVRTELEQLVGQARNLAQRTEYALLRVTIESPEANRAAESFLSRLKDAYLSALSTSQSVILGLVEMLGVVVPLAAIGLLGWLPLRTLRRHAKKRRAILAAKALADPTVIATPR